MSHGKGRERDMEEGEAQQPDEQTRLLESPTALTKRPSYRARRLSSSRVVNGESNKRRWWSGVVAGILGLSCILIATALIISRERDGRHRHDRDGGDGDGDGGKGKDTPDYSKLPPPKPGLRNPAYLLSGYNGAVASEVDVCSQIGVDVLKDGGYATDAAIASALCIGTTNMFSSGIGGGGFMIIRPPTSIRHGNPNCTEPISIDFRETAPTGSHPRMFSPRDDEPDWDAARASRIGGLAVGVPGELRGMEAAYRMCGGGVSWARLVQPSAQLARRSKVGKELARRLNAEVFGQKLADWMLDDPIWSKHFAPEGRLLREGETLVRENYAWTLETIAREGVDVFYTGDIGRSIVKTVQDAGGLLTHSDMANYKAEVRPAYVNTYRNRTYYTGYAPSGGPAIVNLLNTLEGYDEFATEAENGLSVHRFIEALKFAFAARTEIGDPAFIHNKARLHEIRSKAYAARVRHNITDDKTHKLGYYNPRFDIKEDHGTTHVSVIDKYGSAVALTSTVNLIFGSRVMDPKTGIIMNDEMDDFATPGVPDAFGLRPSPFNYPEAGKRPMSSTAPLVMDDEDGDVMLAIGGSGGSRIFGAVAQIILNLDWGHDLSSAVEHPRVHHQLLPAYVSIESGYRPDIIEALEERGHNVTLFDINLGIAEVQAVLRRQTDGRLFAASDSRKNGIAAAF